MITIKTIDDCNVAIKELCRKYNVPVAEFGAKFKQNYNIVLQFFSEIKNATEQKFVVCKEVLEKMDETYDYDFQRYAEDASNKATIAFHQLKNGKKLEYKDAFGKPIFLELSESKKAFGLNTYKIFDATGNKVSERIAKEDEIINHLFSLEQNNIDSSVENIESTNNTEIEQPTEKTITETETSKLLLSPNNKNLIDVCVAYSNNKPNLDKIGFFNEGVFVINSGDFLFIAGTPQKQEIYDVYAIKQNKPLTECVAPYDEKYYNIIRDKFLPKLAISSSIHLVLENIEYFLKTAKPTNTDSDSYLFKLNDAFGIIYKSQMIKAIKSLRNLKHKEISLFHSNTDNAFLNGFIFSDSNSIISDIFNLKCDFVATFGLSYFNIPEQGNEYFDLTKNEYRIFGQSKVINVSEILENRKNFEKSIKNDPKEMFISKFKNFVSVDSSKPQLYGVYFDSKNLCAVATNAHIMLIEKNVAIPSDVVPESWIDKSVKVEPLNEHFRFNDGTYPKYQQLIPTTFAQEININIDELYSLSANAIQKNTVLQKGDRKYEISSTAIEIKYLDYAIYFAPYCIYTILDFFKKQKIKTVALKLNLGNNDYNRIIFESGNYKCLAATMYESDKRFYVKETFTYTIDVTNATNANENNVENTLTSNVGFKKPKNVNFSDYTFDILFKAIRQIIFVNENIDKEKLAKFLVYVDKTNTTLFFKNSFVEIINNYDSNAYNKINKNYTDSDITNSYKSIIAEILSKYGYYDIETKKEYIEKINEKLNDLDVTNENSKNPKVISYRKFAEKGLTSPYDYLPSINKEKEELLLLKNNFLEKFPYIEQYDVLKNGTNTQINDEVGSQIYVPSINEVLTNKQFRNKEIFSIAQAALSIRDRLNIDAEKAYQWLNKFHFELQFLYIIFENPSVFYQCINDGTFTDEAKELITNREAARKASYVKPVETNINNESSEQPTPSIETSNENYEIAKARYSQGNYKIIVKDNVGNTWKNRTANLCEAGGVNGKYSGRENAYIVSENGAKNFVYLFENGYDYSPIADTLELPETLAQDIKKEIFNQLKDQEFLIEMDSSNSEISIRKKAVKLKVTFKTPKKIQIYDAINNVNKSITTSNIAKDVVAYVKNNY